MTNEPTANRPPAPERPPRRTAESAPSRVPVFVISRDGEPERLVALWAEAERLGVDLTRIGATESDGGDDRELLRASDHRRTWERIAGGAVRHAVVLEDGVALDDRLVPLLDAAYLAREVPEHGLVGLDGGRPGEDDPAEGDGATRLVRTPALSGRCAAYVIGRGAAIALLRAPRRAEPLERALARALGVELMLADPAPVLAPAAPEPSDGWMARLRRLGGFGEILRGDGGADAPRSDVPPLRPAAAHD